MEVLDQAVGFLLENKLLLSALVILVIVLIRKLIISMIRGDVNFLSEDQRKWISRTKNGTFSVIIITLFLLWQSEISEFALSLTAIAVAVVVASKEIILCFTGSIQRASSRSFRIGDWIEVGNLCGEVIEHNLMATVIQEIDLHHGNYNYTGKTATLPNSMFFSIPVKNLNFMKRYVYHSFNIVVGEFRNLYPMFPSLLAKIDDHCEDFIDVAKRYNVVIERHAGVDLPGAEPHISISSANTGEQVVHFMLFCPTDRAFEIEQLVREDFMAMYQRHFGQKA
ncbi:mechanosensitive ion channel family protein [Vibrio nigripulchritudo]|uniref:mechanosensitive ion channel family protein n=1 Tax=Vibrio nigripulchritudo TaxID=28173 RepID=UPI0024907657|nr:mechanosensitive ion channel family protein [Vibrio nigripulchritudo]BDU37554.1 mechanosensitive ion channel protein MscS [Vibrio nigripulchritudo]BDU43274.1 mechanosensitive ion channel protein MscS [Vibrio nigripulchritudo]